MIFFAGDRPPTVIATISVYKHLKYAATNTVHRGTNGKLKRFQVETYPRTLFRIIPTNKAAYFFLYFVMNRSCNFFLSSASSLSSFTSGTGRKSQILSFI